MQRLVELVNSNFVKHVEEENYVAIDEQMTVYKGTKCPPGLKQYLPSKPIPHGFKNWARGGVSGYIYEMSFYTGKQEPQSSTSHATRQSTIRADTPDEFDGIKLSTAQASFFE